MKIFDASISPVTWKFFQENLTAKTSLENANILLRSVSGIVCFFETKTDLQELKEKVFQTNILVEEPDRAEYGDFQTNMDLAVSVANTYPNM